MNTYIHTAAQNHYTWTPPFPTQADCGNGDDQQQANSLLDKQKKWVWELGRSKNTTFTGICPSGGWDGYLMSAMNKAGVTTEDQKTLLQEFSAAKKYAALPKDAPEQIFKAVRWYEDHIPDVQMPDWTRKSPRHYPRLYLCIFLYGLMRIDFPFARDRIKKAFQIASPNTIQRFLKRCIRSRIIQKVHCGKAYDYHDKSSTIGKGESDRFRFLGNTDWIINPPGTSKDKLMQWRRYLRENIPWTLSQQLRNQLTKRLRINAYDNQDALLEQFAALKSTIVSA